MIHIKDAVRFSILITILVLASTACDRSPDFETENKNSSAYILERFQDPPIEYRSAPFWVWAGDVSEEEIDLQLTDMKEHGMGGAFLHARPGMITEYLSDEWFDLANHAVEVGKKENIHIWLYDEHSWPSGYAGGHVAAEMPDSYIHGQGLQMVPIEDIDTSDLSDYYLFLRETDEGYEVVDDHSDLNDAVFGFRMHHYSQTGRYGGYSYVDLLVDGVTEKFIELTMTGYEERFGEEFGRQVPGIFTDEPHIQPPSVPSDDPHGRTTRYTPDLYDVFEDTWGYDLRKHLPSLFIETGDWQRIRHNYYQVLLDMFIERWGKPWYEYTEEHNLTWTGHYWEHTWPDPIRVPDNMAIYAYKQMPGIDLLFNTPEERPDQFGNVRNVREVRSVANQLGRTRTLSETFGASGWELDFEDMKRHGDWMYALGINFLTEHMYYGTLKGSRKRDFPQSISYHAPWWPHYPELSNYFARLSLALSTGRQINTTLVIDPTTATWMYQGANGIHERRDQIGDSFKSLLDQLELHKIEYDMGSEFIIKRWGSVDDGKFIVGEKVYDQLILPEGTDNLNRATVDLLRQYLEQGGTVLDLSGVPGRVDGVQSDEVLALAELFSDQWFSFDALTGELLEKLAVPGFSPFSPENFGGKIFHQRRQLDDGQLFFWSNWSTTEPGEIEFSASGNNVIEFDAVSGAVKSFPFEHHEESVSVSFTLPPTGSKMLFISDGSADFETSPYIEKSSTGEQIEPAGPVAAERMDPNVLVIDYVDLQVKEHDLEDIYFYDAADLIYESHGFEWYSFGHNPWNVGVQYRTNILDMAHKFDEESSFTATFPFYVTEELTNRESLRAVIERAHLYEISINGETIEPLEIEWWLDRAFNVFEIGEYLQSGRNELVIHASPISIHAELEPVYLLGDFYVEEAGQGFTLKNPDPLDLGSWKDQGLPLFGHRVSYSNEFEIDETDGIYQVELGDWYGTVAEVIVNGQSAGVIGWQPYQLNVSDYLTEGNNKIEVIVTGSLKNTLGPHHNDPEVGFVTPWSFFFAPESQPAGEDYHTLDYGLFDD
ncbi:MAG: hypothetical protein EA359_00330, partial [Balneolaceae bacterium]